VSTAIPTPGPILRGLGPMPAGSTPPRHGAPRAFLEESM